MTFTVTLADADLELAEEYLAIRAAEHDVVRVEDRIVGMVLGAAKAAGYGKRKRRQAKGGS
jgi:hypothetical protein